MGVAVWGECCSQCKPESCLLGVASLPQDITTLLTFAHMLLWGIITMVARSLLFRFLWCCSFLARVFLFEGLRSASPALTILRNACFDWSSLGTLRVSQPFHTLPMLPVFEKSVLSK